MAIDMSNVNKIEMPVSQVTIYKKKVYLTISSVVYKGTSTPCPVEVTIFSKTTDTRTINEAIFHNVLVVECGYTSFDFNGISRCYLTVDNPYEFTYNNGTYDCVFASLQVRDNGIYLWFSVPETTTTSVSSGWTITEDPWQEVGSYQTFDYEYKTYLDTTAGSYTNFTVGKNYITGDEYIASYCINGVSYPDVTIASVSGDTYTLSNGEVITISSDYSSSFSPSDLEVYSIIDITGNILWEKANAYGYHIKVGNYYINHGSSYNVTSSTDASTTWYTAEDNRIYCLVNDTKYYLQCQTRSNRVVYADTTTGSSYVWLYKNGNYITTTINDTTYYLYRYGSGSAGIRMQTTAIVITFESNDPRTHTADWHTIWEGDYSITCEAINGQMVKQPESNMVIYHILPKVSSIATSYSNMQIKVYYQFSWIGNRGTSTPGNTSLTEYTVSNLSSNKTILNLPVSPTDNSYSLIDFIASGVSWNATTGNIEFETRGILQPEDTEYMKTTIRITKIELYC